MVSFKTLVARVTIRVTKVCHRQIQELKLGGQGRAPKAPREVECGEGCPPPHRGKGLGRGIF